MILQGGKKVDIGAAVKALIAVLLTVAVAGCQQAAEGPAQDTSDEAAPETPGEAEPAPPTEEDGSDQQSEHEGDLEGSDAGPALADWDGRRYDLGTASNPRDVDGGFVVEWDRHGLLTSEPAGEDEDGQMRDPDAFSQDPVEPWRSIVDQSGAPFTNESTQLRDLTVTEAAWAFEVVEDDVVCPGDERDPEAVPPPWREVDLDEWRQSLEEDSATVLLTFDAVGRVVQIRPPAGC